MGAARQPVKLAGIGTTVGILGGLASGRGDDKLRSAGRGAIKGMGFDVGAGMGGALGGALGMATLNPALGIAGLVGGGLGGGMLGQSMASSAIGPYETEEEKFERMLAARESAQLKLKNKEKAAMSLYLFGAKLANYVDLHDAPTSDELISRAKDVKNEAERTGRPVVKDYAKKQLPPHEVFQNALRRAEASGESPSPELFSRMQKEHDSAQKKAQSACSPCAMPNGPKNKPYTSASPAVTDASQKSVEIGKPPVAKTEHSAAKAKLPEEGVKSAYAFGRKVAAGFEGVTGVPYSPQSLSAPSNYADLADDMRANQFSPRGSKNTAPRLSTGTGNLVAKQQHLNKLQTELNNAPRTNIGPRNMADTVVDAWAAGSKGIVSGLNNARLSAGRQLGEMWAAGGDDGGRGYQGPPGSTPQVSGKVGPKPDAPAAGKGTGAAGGGMMDYLTNPYVVGGGVGALGLGGLLYYLNSQPKKKKRDEEEEV
jgi:hypothetical protein